MTVKDVTIIQWLTKLEEEMRLTLSAILGEAITELQALLDAPSVRKFFEQLFQNKKIK